MQTPHHMYGTFFMLSRTLMICLYLIRRMHRIGRLVLLPRFTLTLVVNSASTYFLLYCASFLYTQQVFLDAAMVIRNKSGKTLRAKLKQSSNTSKNITERPGLTRWPFRSSRDMNRLFRTMAKMRALQEKSHHFRLRGSMNACHNGLPLMIRYLQILFIYTWSQLITGFVFLVNGNRWLPGVLRPHLVYW